jgi:DNA-binding IclR family transcriptional regulator
MGDVKRKHGASGSHRAGDLIEVIGAMVQEGLLRGGETGARMSESGSENGSAGQGDGGYGHNQAIRRAVAILEELARVPSGLSLSELAKAVSLPTPTVFRMVRTLEEVRLLARAPGTRRIVLGIGITRIAAGFVGGRELLTAARALVDSLAAETGEGVEIAAVIDNRGLDVMAAIDVMYRVESRYALRAATHGPLPIHMTSLGKILLSHRPVKEVDRILSTPLVAWASGTITDPQRLKKEITKARQDGFALGIDEIEEGAAGVAACVHDAMGHLVGILHVEAPSIRLGPERCAEIVELALGTARKIEKALTDQCH